MAIALHHSVITYPQRGNTPKVAWICSRSISDDIDLFPGITANNENLGANVATDNTIPPSEIAEPSETKGAAPTRMSDVPTAEVSDIGETRKTSEVQETTEDNESASPKKNYIETDDLFRHAISIESLKKAWAELKSNPGMMTKGTDGETLSGITEKWFSTANQKLLEGTYEYPRRRRKYIPKAGREEKRPITITNPRVKIIEKAILNAIEPLYEGVWKWERVSPSQWELLKETSKEANSFKQNKDGYFMKRWNTPKIFLSTSHGFRPGRSAHTALASVKKWRQNVTWLLDYDIRKAFDNVNRNRLKNLLSHYIKDPRLWKEIQKMMNTGILDPSEIFEETGVPQGSVLAPFLFNIYLHELDVYVEKLKTEFETTKVNHENQLAEKAYWKIINNFRLSALPTRLTEYGDVNSVLEARRKALAAHSKKYGRMEGIDMTSRHIHYVRYADDFIIGIVGPKEFALEIRDRIDTFIKGNLHLEVKKNDIVNRNEGSVRFLGFNIKLAPFHKKTRSRKSEFESSKRYKKRVTLRLVNLDRKLAQATSAGMKAILLRTYRRGLENSKKKLEDKKTKEEISEAILDRWNTYFPDDEELEEKNDALLRREKALTNLFCRTLEPTLEKTIRSLGIMVTESVLAREIHAAKVQYISELERIHRKLVTLEKESADEPALKAYEKWEGLGKHKKPVTREQFLQYSQLLRMDQINQPRGVNISLLAPISDTVSKLRTKGFYHPQSNRPIGVPFLFTNSDTEIIQYYNRLMRGFINWFRPADNFDKVKSLVESLRISCIYTLGRKHKKSQRWVRLRFGADIRNEEAALPTQTWVRELGGGFISSEPSYEPKFNLEALTNPRMIFKANKYFERCAVTNCANSDIEVHHVRRLNRRINQDGKLTVLDGTGRRVVGFPAVMTAIQRKQIPLCRMHHREFEKGVYSEIDIEYMSKAFKSGKVENLEAIMKTGKSP